MHSRAINAGLKVAAVMAMASLCCIGKAAAQDGVWVRVNTNLPNAVLYADSVRVGRVPVDFVRLSSSVSELRLAAPDASSWSVAPVSSPLGLSAGDSAEVTINFPHYYRIETMPFGATVHHEVDDGRALLGTTPVTLTFSEPPGGAFAVERSGFVVERLVPGNDVWNRYVVTLKPSTDPDPTAAQVQWKPPHKRRAWIDYAAIGTAIAAGIVAVHYKFEADDLYAEYELTTDQSLRPQIRRYDVRSGVAFGVMQAGIGLFAIRLALR